METNEEVVSYPQKYIPPSLCLSFSFCPVNLLQTTQWIDHQRCHSGVLRCCGPAPKRKKKNPRSDPPVQRSRERTRQEVSIWGTVVFLVWMCAHVCVVGRTFPFFFTVVQVPIIHRSTSTIKSVPKLRYSSCLCARSVTRHRTVVTADEPGVDGRWASTVERRRRTRR